MALRNLCLAENGGTLADSANEAMRDDNFTAVALNVAQTQASGVTILSSITFPSRYVTQIDFGWSSGPSASNGYSYFYVYLYYGGDWQQVWTSGKVATVGITHTTLTTGWAGVTGIRCYSSTAPEGGAYSQMSWMEQQAWGNIGGFATII